MRHLLALHNNVDSEKTRHDSYTISYSLLDHYLIFRDEMAAKDYEMEKLREEIRKLQQVVVPASMTEADLQLC